MQSDEWNKLNARIDELALSTGKHMGAMQRVLDDRIDRIDKGLRALESTREPIFENKVTGEKWWACTRRDPNRRTDPDFEVKGSILVAPCMHCHETRPVHELVRGVCTVCLFKGRGGDLRLKVARAIHARFGSAATFDQYSERWLAAADDILEIEGIVVRDG